MIVINVRVQVKSEKLSEFIAVAKQDVQVARVVAGCVKYGWSQDISNPDQFVLYEEWASQQQFDAYKQSEHFKQLNQTFAPLMSGAPESSYYQAALLEAA